MRTPSVLLASALALALLHGSGAAAQMCSLDAGCDDAGADAAVPDASVRDGGEHDGGGGDGGASDGGMSLDASLPDAGGDAGTGDAGTSDAGGEGPSVAACSCETALESDGRIHVCTGSFDRDVCRSFDCDQGSPRSERCPDRDVRLCCTMEARRLYSELYTDCSHANCESGFRAQCEEFGGVVTFGACEAPDLPDDPDTETGSDMGCAVRPGSRAPFDAALMALATVALAVVRRRGRR